MQHSCQHCGRSSPDQHNDFISITRAFYAPLFFHKKCFREIAGDEYIPKRKMPEVPYAKEAQWSPFGNPFPSARNYETEDLKRYILRENEAERHRQKIKKEATSEEGKLRLKLKYAEYKSKR